MATGAAAMARVTAWLRTRSRQRVAASVKRWSSAWGETATPSVAAVWASSSRAACGLARKPKTNVWLKVAPPSGEVRWTNLVARAASSAVVVKSSCMVVATCVIVVIGKLLRTIMVSDNSMMPQLLPFAMRSVDANGGVGRVYPGGQGGARPRERRAPLAAGTDAGGGGTQAPEDASHRDSTLDANASRSERG